MIIVHGATNWMSLGLMRRVRRGQSLDGHGSMGRSTRGRLKEFTNIVWFRADILVTIQLQCRSTWFPSSSTLGLTEIPGVAVGN